MRLLTGAEGTLKLFADAKGATPGAAEAAGRPSPYGPVPPAPPDAPIAICRAAYGFKPLFPFRSEG